MLPNNNYLISLYINWVEYIAKSNIYAATSGFCKL